MQLRFKIGNLTEIRFKNSKSRITAPIPAGMFFKKLALQLAACLLCFPVLEYAAAENPPPPSRQTLETKYTKIIYKTYEDLEKFNTCLNFDQKEWSLKQMFSDAESDNLSSELGMKVDNLHERVQEILDMRKRFPKVTINLYADRKQLDEAFFRIYQKKNKMRAWYIFEKNTIYANIEDLHQGMLAHEMAHAIINHFVQIRLPAASSEILARYVDSHINR